MKIFDSYKHVWQDYMELMKEIFDFPKIAALLKGDDGRPKFNITVNSLHGGLSHMSCSPEIYSFSTLAFHINISV